MSETARTNAAEMRYLLGDLTESERTRMEEVFFADDSKFEEMQVAEDELIDAYVRNDLSPEEQRQFKARLLSSPRVRERINFARVLASKADSLLPPQAEEPKQAAAAFSSSANRPMARRWRGFFAQQPAWGMAMACAILILVPSVVLISGWLRLRNESAQLAADRSALQRQREELDKLSADQRTSTEQSRAELQKATDHLAEDRRRFEESVQAQKRESGPQAILGTVASILLRSGSVRSGGGDPRELRLHPGTSVVQLKLVLQNNDYRSYSVSVTTPDENVVHHDSSLRPRTSKQGPLLILSIPTSKLPPDDYTVEIYGHTASGQVDKLPSYPFRVLPSK